MLPYRRSVIFAIICVSSALTASCFETPGTCESDTDCFAGEVCQNGVCRIPSETGSPTDTTPPPDTNRVDSSDTAAVDSTDPSDTSDTTQEVDTATDTGPACMVDRDCDAPQRCCSNECVDVDTNSSHCGSCSEACSDSESCVEGSCEPDSCTAEARCPTDSDTVECVNGDCRAQTCTGSKHPCEGGRKCCDWSVFGTVASPGYRTNINLAYDDTDRRFVAYWENLNGERSNRVVKLAEADATPPQWSTSKVSETQPAGSGVSLAVDSQNRPHLIYRRSVDGTDELRWVRRDSSGWFRKSPLTDVTGGNWALAIDASDAPRAVFQRGSSAAYTAGPSNNWSVRNLGSLNSTGSPDGLETDPTGLPHLVFPDDDDKIVYTWKAPAAGWLNEDLHPQEQSFHADLELNASSLPEVAFDEAGSDNVFFAKKDSNGWSETKLSADGQHARLVIDADGTRRVYFFRSTGDNKFAIREARRIDGNWQVKTLQTVQDNLVEEELDVALDSDDRPGLIYTVEDKIKFLEW